MDELTKFGGKFTDLNSAASSGRSLANSLPATIPGLSGTAGLLSDSELGSLGQLTGDITSKLNIPGLKLPDISMPGAMFSGGTTDDSVACMAGDYQPAPKGEGAPDLRIRIAPQLSAIDQIYGPIGPNNILTPLRSTMGMMFPFTPTIDWSQQVEYTSTSLVHSNQDYLTYKNTPSTSIKISGEFVVQHHNEGKYLLAVMHFLRTVSKMYFGKPSFNAPSTNSPSLSGMPPPILVLSGYGNYMFNDLPVIVRDHMYGLKPDVSYVDILTAGGIARLPAIMTISVTLVVQNTPQKHRDEFDLDKFRTGELMRSPNKGWI